MFYFLFFLFNKKLFFFLFFLMMLMRRWRGRENVFDDDFNLTWNMIHIKFDKISSIKIISPIYEYHKQENIVQSA